MYFEVASVKQDRDPGGNIHSNMTLLGDSNAFTPTGGLFRATDLPLAAYIIFAYKQLTDDERQCVMAQLPKWANINRYDIEAHASGNPAKEDQFRLMMQALLADRFKLAVHFEAKQVPVMALALAKPGKLGPQFRPHAANSPCPLGADNAGKTVDGGFPEVCGKFAFLPPTDPGCVRLGARNLSMAAIATLL